MTIDRHLQGWCLQGQLRTSIIKTMERAMTLTQIKKKLKDDYKSVSLSNISDVVREMMREGLCICHNPDMQKGRLYELGEKLKEVREELMKE